MSFNIVEFTESKMVDVVPTTWLFRGNEILQCYWPTYKASRLKKAIILEEDPSGDCWSLFNIKIIKTFETYDDARKKLGLAEDTDNLDSEAAGQEVEVGEEKREEGVRFSIRKKFPAKRPLDSSSSEEEEETSKKTKKCLPNIEFPTKIITNNEVSSPRPLSPPHTVTTPRPLSPPHTVTSPLSSVSSPHATNLRQDDQPTRPTIGFSTDQSKDCLQKILKRLETLCAVQEQHSIVLQELMANSRLSLDVGCTERPEMMPDLPLSTLNDLELWEDFITTNKTNYTYACKLLSSVGGGNAAQATRRIMKRLITSKLAQSFNWAGRAPKKPFKELATKSLIFARGVWCLSCLSLRIASATSWVR